MGYIPNRKMPDDASDIARIISNAVSYAKGNKCKTDEEVAKRIKQFWGIAEGKGEIPQFEQLCAYLGESTEKIMAWSKGDGCSTKRKDLIQTAITTFKTIDASLVAKGYIGTVEYIWRSKQYYGMREPSNKIEIENTSPLKDLPNAETIEARYIAEIPDEEGEDEEE